jgi:transposase
MSMSNTTKRVREIRRKTRRKFSSEEKIRIVLEGLRGEDSIAELCRREGINSNLYYRWSKDFLEAGKRHLAGDTVREANSAEVGDLKKEKQAVAELYLRNDWLIKSLTGQGVILDDD